MILSPGFAPSAVSKVTVGNFFLVRTANEVTLGLRAEDQQSPGRVSAVLFNPEQPAFAVLDYEMPCLDLGKACVVKVPGLLAAVTDNADADVIGNLAIRDGSICVISAARGKMGFIDPLYVNLQTGIVTDTKGTRWYATQWELGIEGKGDVFETLYKRN